MSAELRPANKLLEVAMPSRKLIVLALQGSVLACALYAFGSNYFWRHRVGSDIIGDSVVSALESSASEELVVWPNNDSLDRTQARVSTAAVAAVTSHFGYGTLEAMMVIGSVLAMSITAWPGAGRGR